MERPPRILYAEDNENDAELALMAFNESDFENQIDIVSNGHDAIDYLNYHGKYSTREKINPSFILLDIKMPGMDGLEVLKAIRNKEETKNFPVVMLTSSKIESDIILSYSYGANGFVIKPTNFDDFVEIIKGIGNFWVKINTSPSIL